MSVTYDKTLVSTADSQDVVATKIRMQKTISLVTLFKTKCSFQKLTDSESSCASNSFTQRGINSHT